MGFLHYLALLAVFGIIEGVKHFVGLDGDPNPYIVGMLLLSALWRNEPDTTTHVGEIEG